MRSRAVVRVRQCEWCAGLHSALAARAPALMEHVPEDVQRALDGLELEALGAFRRRLDGPAAARARRRGVLLGLVDALGARAPVSLVPALSATSPARRGASRRRRAPTSTAPAGGEPAPEFIDLSGQRQHSMLERCILRAQLRILPAQSRGLGLRGGELRLQACLSGYHPSGRRVPSPAFSSTPNAGGAVCHLARLPSAWPIL